MIAAQRKYKKVLKLIVSASLILFIGADLAGCETGTNMQTELPTAYSSTPQVFDLSPEQKLDLDRKANEGDNSAALRLNEYYALTIGDPEQGIPYLRMAVERGSLKAMWILAAHFESSEDGRHCEALALYEKLSMIETQAVERNKAMVAKASLQTNLDTKGSECP